MKKTIATLVASALALSVLAACDPNGTTQDPSIKDQTKSPALGLSQPKRDSGAPMTPATPLSPTVPPKPDNK
jgi:uncharacterized lipoprotein